MKKILALVLAVVLVAAAAIGGTTAYFTDTTSSTNNIIATGTLNVELEWANGTEDLSAANWQDASVGAIFNNNLWEPGYTEVRHIRISNEGTLALDYSVSIEGIAESKLAEAIEVYFFDPAMQIASRAALANETSVGMLNDVLANGTTIGTGDLGAGEADTLTIALKMDEDAGNEYQKLDLGSFSVVVYAEQAMVENDSFGNDYDSGAGADPNLPSDLPKASVTEITDEVQERIFTIYDISDGIKVTDDTTALDVAYVFEATESAEEVANSPYKDWHADFVISFTEEVKKNTAGLGGDYGDFSNLAFYAPFDIPANTPMRLLESFGTITYEYVCTDVETFLCGAFDVNGQNEGTVMTVQLNIYEVGENGEETGLSYTIGEYDYTF